LAPDFPTARLAVEITDNLAAVWALREDDGRQRREWLQRAADLAQQTGQRTQQASCIRRLGDVHVSLSESAQARQRYEEALPIYRAIGDRLGEANCYLALGRVTDSAEFFERAIQIHAAIQAHFSEARDLYYYGLWQRGRGDLPAALDSLTQALGIFEQVGVISAQEAVRRAIVDTQAAMSAPGDK